MSESLVQYGTSFQSKLIVSLMMDVKYTTTIIDILDVSYFDSDANKFLVKSIKDYFLKYKSPPTIEALKVMIDEVQADVLKTSIVDSLRQVWTHREATDLDFVKEKSLEFCKNQVMKNAIMQSVDLLEQQNYDEIKSMIDGAMNAGAERFNGLMAMLGIVAGVGAYATTGQFIPGIF